MTDDSRETFNTAGNWPGASGVADEILNVSPPVKLLLYSLVLNQLIQLQLSYLKLQ